MKKFFAFMIMAAALAACTRVEQPRNETPEQPEVPATYTLMLQASKGTDTRALELDGTTLKAFWDGNEKVTAHLNGEDVSMTIDLGGQSKPASCTLKGTFSQAPKTGDVLTLELNGNNYTNQDGTLAYIGANCDYAIATVTVTGVNEGTIETVEGAANFENQQAIVKFTLMDKTTDAAISPSALSVKGNGDVVATVTGINAPSDGVLFVAIPAISGAIDLSATVGSVTYKYSRSSVSFSAGEYYSITVKMDKASARVVNLEDESLYEGGYLFTAQDGDVLTGTFPDASWKHRRIEIASGATVTLRDVTIENQSIVYPALAMNSSATIILEGTNTVSSRSNSAGITIGGSGSTLTITGYGELTVTGGWQGAGIGTGNTTAGANVSYGSIIISGGTIKATGGSGAAGIGCGSAAENSEIHIGSITINGGNVEATGLDGGAGIGGGKVGSNAVGSCGDINISSPAVVTAKMDGNVPPYSIGPSISGQCGTVTIYGTTYVSEPGGILSRNPLNIPLTSGN